MSAAVELGSQPRTVHVERCMGTVFTIDIRDSGAWRGAVGDVVRWLHQVDAVFSTYQPNSQISRIERGELRVCDAHPDVAVVLDLCACIQAETDGCFSAMRQGRLDPTGLVKGWAVERASLLLRERGALNHAINGGGDVQVAGEAAPGRPWTVGIADPHDRSRVIASVSGRDFAIATSGTTERGAHIVDPFTGKPPVGLVSATVTGPSLTFADAYATAAFVMGDDALGWIGTRADFDAILVTADGNVRATPGLRKLR